MQELQQSLNMKLARNPIKKWREENQLSKSALALLLGVSLQAINQYECGIMKPSTDKLSTLRDITGIEDIKERLEAWHDSN